MAVMPDSLVYLDNAATTSLDERVLEAMLPYLRRGGPNGLPRGNPSSLHASGTAARQAVEEARTSVARLVGASPGEILFTAGGTEADNLAVLGLAAASREEARGDLRRRTPGSLRSCRTSGGRGLRVDEGKGR